MTAIAVGISIPLIAALVLQFQKDNLPPMRHP